MSLKHWPEPEVTRGQVEATLVALLDGLVIDPPGP